VPDLRLDAGWEKLSAKLWAEYHPPR